MSKGKETMNLYDEPETITLEEYTRWRTRDAVEVAILHVPDPTIQFAG